MALGRLSVKVGKTGKAGPHAAYISRSGEYQRYTERGEKLEAVVSGNMPAWAEHDPLLFWKAADENERKNGTTYREFEIALPRELDTNQRRELVADFVKKELGDLHAYQYAIHVPKAADGDDQPHVHLMFSERRRDGIERDPEQYFKRYNSKTPENGGAKKGYGPSAGKTLTRAQRGEELQELRRRWENLCNRHLARAGIKARIDMRSHAERGTGLTPEPKLHPGAMQRRTADAERVLAQRNLAKQIPDFQRELAAVELRQRMAESRRAAIQSRRLEAQQESRVEALKKQLAEAQIERANIFTKREAVAEKSANSIVSLPEIVKADFPPEKVLEYLRVNGPDSAGRKKLYDEYLGKKLTQTERHKLVHNPVFKDLEQREQLHKDAKNEAEKTYQAAFERREQAAWELDQHKTKGGISKLLNLGKTERLERELASAQLEQNRTLKLLEQAERQAEAATRDLNDGRSAILSRIRAARGAELDEIAAKAAERHQEQSETLTPTQQQAKGLERSTEPNRAPERQEKPKEEHKPSRGFRR